MSRSTRAGWTGGTACCLELLLSEQDDLRELQNTIQELIVSRGHHCIFLPKYHPELNFIERYLSRVKWYARQAQRRDRRWAQGHREP